MLRFLLILSVVLPVAGCTKYEDGTARQLEEDIQAIEAYLAANSLTATRTGSGLHYIITDPGSGTSFPAANSRVTVGYRGYYLNGVVFDQSPPGQPATFFLNQVIAGWQEGIRLFRKGGKGILLIPSSLAYGPFPPAGIPPNAVMAFDVELVDFQ